MTHLTYAFVYLSWVNCLVIHQVTASGPTRHLRSQPRPREYDKLVGTVTSAELHSQYLPGLFYPYRV